MYHALERLGAVEVLLLLEEVHVAGDGDAADGLAVGGVREGDAFVVGEVEAVVFALAAVDDARDFGDDVGGPFVGGLHVRHPGGTALGSEGAYGCCGGAQRVLAGVHLVGVWHGRA